MSAKPTTTGVNAIKDDKDDSIPLIQLMLRVAKKIGMPTLKEYLTDIDKKNPSMSDDRLKGEIISTVAEYYDVDPLLFTDQERFSRDETKHWGIIYIIAILYKYSNYRRANIGDIFGLGYKSVGHKISIFQKLDRDNRIDKQRLAVYDEIENMLIAKKAIKKK